MLGSLPPRVRELYGLSWSRVQEAELRAVVAAVRASRPITPRSIRRGRNGTEFDRVARTEAERIERGEYTPQAA